VGTAGALLGYIGISIEVDDAIGTGIGIKTTPAAIAQLRVNDNQPVVPPVDGILWAGIDAGSILTVLAGNKYKRHLDVRYLSPDVLI